ncbi:hypothetical protein EXIGLDRAFT_833274 [Exidia glandulosa HHB12029]|uniref:Ricin B lectin domain-containing protein n=1 Tax=Exidia glandulosa HHB12029 TaxID=1314781 RepID=A0A165KTC5_EXIGL|nr:hypothetical protein EXIGLDRAFT_833274 [Exidia glandulosa HHB12029]
MFAASILALVPCALAVVPPSGNYSVFNPSTTGIKNYWDVAFGNTQPPVLGVTPIIAQTLNGPPPSTTNQQWEVFQLFSIGSRNLYMFRSRLGQFDFFGVNTTNGGATLEMNPTLFELTEVVPGSFSIAIQGTNSVLTAQAASTQQIGVSPSVAGNQLQLWEFTSI